MDDKNWASCGFFGSVAGSELYNRPHEFIFAIPSYWDDGGAWEVGSKFIRSNRSIGCTSEECRVWEVYSWCTDIKLFTAVMWRSYYSGQKVRTAVWLRCSDNGGWGEGRGGGYVT